MRIKPEVLDSAASYCVSALCIFGGWVIEVQGILTALTVLIGFIIAVLRLAYDLRKFLRDR